MVAEIPLDSRDFERLSLCTKRHWLKCRPNTKKNFFRLDWQPGMGALTSEFILYFLFILFIDQIVVFKLIKIWLFVGLIKTVLLLHAFSP